MRPLAVFDIDGVLADVSHRLHHVEAKPRDWQAFFAGAALDAPLRPGIELLLELASSHELRYLTGRPERLRTVTRSWLAEQGLPGAELAMRGNRDFRPARIFKRERLLAWLDAGEQIAVVVDDDPQVVAMLREIDLPVVAADWQDGRAVDVLRLVQEVLGRS